MLTIQRVFIIILVLISNIALAEISSAAADKKITVSQAEKEKMLAVLKQFIDIPTAKQNDQPQYKNKNIIKIGEEIKKLAANFGLKFKNYDNHIFTVTLPGKTSETVGLYVHADVVPVNKSQWVLKNGRQLDPYKATVIDGRIYGRGVLDDKGSLVAALFAMKNIQRSGVVLKNTIRLVIDTSEETSGGEMAYYLKRSKLPKFNIGLDAAYPVVIAEKGTGFITAEFPLKAIAGEGAEIISMTGGVAPNQIPGISIAFIKTKDSTKLAEAFKLQAKHLKQQHPGNYDIEVKSKPGEVIVKIRGVSVHSSTPWKGVNPVSRMFVLLNRTSNQVPFKHNAYYFAAKYINDNFAMDYFGKTLGIDYKDSFMGPLTATPTFITEKRGNLQVIVNVRMPNGKTAAQLENEINEKLAAYKEKTGLHFSLKTDLEAATLRDPNLPLVKTLLKIYNSVTAQQKKPLSLSGATNMRTLPGGLSFGPGLPGVLYLGHQPNEYKTIKHQLLDLKLITAMILKVGNLP